MNEDLPTLLTALPEPEAPATLSAAVMARIRRESEAVEVPRAEPLRRDRPWWALTTIGAMAACAIVAAGWWAAGMAPDYLGARIGPGRAPLTWLDTSMTGALALALLGYLAGLFAPARQRT